MEQRPLRLGDILDDYCPRERRVTNHAIVAMIEDDVRQTRCTTCDAEHAYKGGKAPRRRARKESPAALYNEVLSGMPDADAAPAPTAPARAVEPPADLPASLPQMDAARPPLETPPAEHSAAPVADEAPAPREPEAAPAGEDGPVHRPLIRATLPRIEGQKEARPIPDFTIRQPLGRGRFRGAGGDGRPRFRGGSGGNGNGNGHRSAGGSRFGGPRAGGGRRRGR
jgi:uncharacterized membrane protein YgcG